jgi:hypothetical protein
VVTAPVCARRAGGARDAPVDMWTTQGRCPQIHRASNSSQLSDLMMTSKQAGPPLPVTSQQLTLPPPPTSSSRRCAIFAQIQAAIDNRSYAAAPLLYDIAAVQTIYGADMTTRTGNTIYGFNSNAGREIDGFLFNPFDFTQNPDPVFAIWDAGGIDTIDASGFSTNQTIDLRAGQFSSIGYLTNNVAVAFGATIENAIGGSGHDHLFGNETANHLIGNDGIDNMHGFLGNDTLDGGEGDDVLFGLTDSDHIEVFVTDRDTLLGGGGNDQLFGGGDNDTLDGDQGSDRLAGGEGDDTFVFSLNENAVSGHDIVLDFDPGDRIQLLDFWTPRGGFAWLTNSGIMQQVSVNGLASTLLAFDADTSLTLLGVTPSQLIAENFLFQHDGIWGFDHELRFA